MKSDFLDCLIYWGVQLIYVRNLWKTWYHRNKSCFLSHYSKEIVQLTETLHDASLWNRPQNYCAPPIENLQHLNWQRGKPWNIIYKSIKTNTSGYRNIHNQHKLGFQLFASYTVRGFRVGCVWSRTIKFHEWIGLVVKEGVVASHGRKVPGVLGFLQGANCKIQRTKLLFSYRI